MGYGDDLLVTSLAAIEKKKHPDRQIVIGNLKKKNASHSIIYENNPNISDCRNLDKNKEILLIDYHPENRPYIDYEKSTNKKYIWKKNFKAIPGELFFSNEENIKASQIIKNALNYWYSINKTIKPKAIIFLETTSTKIKHKNFSIKHINKSWGYNNWLNLVNKLKHKYLFINSVHEYSSNINGIFNADNMNFRLACAIMDQCNLYVGPEGGFSHVAGALKKKAVVYYGGWISPEIIGYDFHENLYFNDPNSPCGLYREICNHCENARKSITVSIFEESISKLIAEGF